MGNFAGSLGGHFNLFANVYEISSNTAANSSVVRIDLYISCDSTGTGEWNLTGSASWGANVNGNTAGGNFNYDFRGNNNTIHLATYDTNVGHDVNGGGTIGWSASANMDNSPSLTTAGISSSLGLGRLPLAPSIAYIGADTIKPTSVNLYTEINNYGHGSSAACHFHYKLDTDGSYTQTGDQGDVGGNNNFAITGLIPGRTYDYYVTWFNNNGDAVDSGVQTFGSQPVSGMLAVMKAIA